MRIAICGKFKSGKTSLVNLLFGLNLPVQAVTATRFVTQIEKGGCSYMETEDGARIEITPDKRNELILGGNEPDNSRIRRIITGCSSPLFGGEGEITFWDTPGLEDTAELTDITMKALEQCDLAILVFDANKFGSWCEKLTLEKLQDILGGNVVYVINRIDLLNSAEDLQYVKKSAECLLGDYGNDLIGRGHILYTSASPQNPDISMLYDFISRLADDEKMCQSLCDTAERIRRKNEPVKQKIPAVCPLSGQQNGIRIPLEGRQICFGRDSTQCQILYRDGTPGVSRFHCTLVWNEDRGEFILADMDSTYGTFLKNGTRLTPGKLYSLKSGESFYLGDRNNEVVTGFVKNVEGTGGF